MTNPHKTPPLALTMRGYIKLAPENWRAHMAAAADAVEECAKLRADLAAARSCAPTVMRAEATEARLREVIGQRDKAEAGLAATRALLREARERGLGSNAGWRDYLDRIDAELAKETK